MVDATPGDAGSDHFRVLRYGPGPEQFGELRVPADDGRDRPLVALIHGGFWRDRYRLDLMHDIARALHDRGHPTWNIEYRRVGPTGGGYPTTLADVAAAIDRCAGLAGFESRRLAVVGHSAGGHLALWNASRPDKKRPPALTVSLAGVCDVIAANRNGVGTDATTNFFGGDYPQVAAAYHDAQPDPQRFTGRVVLIHGDADESVPTEQSLGLRAFADRLEILSGVDHFDVIDPSGTAWQIVFDELDTLLP